jgi:small nuclear ribonucleoprotein (snRNP)-like protein
METVVIVAADILNTAVWEVVGTIEDTIANMPLTSYVEAILGYDINDKPLTVEQRVDKLIEGALRSVDSFCNGLMMGGTIEVVGTLGLPFSMDQQALVDLAKQAQQKGGLSASDAAILTQWAKEYGIPVRGPEAHLGRFNPFQHIHIGPINHIPVK